MANILSPEQTTSNANNGKKQRKKQAKREAKAMLKLEQAQQDVQRAEQKLAKTQAQLEALRTHVRDLEANLDKIRNSQQQDNANIPAATTVSAPANEENHAHVSMPTNEVISLPPSEGRTDVSEDNQTPASAQAEEVSTPAQENLSEFPEAVGATDEAQQDSVEDATTEGHEEESSPSRDTHRTSRSRRHSNPGDEEETTEEGNTDAGQDDTDAGQ